MTRGDGGQPAGSRGKAHVTGAPAFPRPLLPNKTRSHGEPTLMPSSSETLKRKRQGDIAKESFRIAKKTRTSDPPTSRSVTRLSSETASKTKAPIILPDSAASLVKPTTSDTLVHYGSLKVQESSVAPPTTPQRAERPVTSVVKMSTSSLDPSCISPSQSSSFRSGGGPKARESQQTQQATASNEVTKVPLQEIQHILKHELHGSVYLHKEFFKEFLDPKPIVQTQVLQRARNMSTQPARSLGRSNHVNYDQTSSRWTLAEVITKQRSEKLVYEPLAKALNVIGQAAFDVYHGMYPNDTIRKAYFPFVNHSAKETRGDSPSDGTVMPDLLQGRAEDDRIHWGDTEMIIECKSTNGTKHRNEAFVKISRYARATFSHQIYRNWVFAFALCGSNVTFLRFDRSGILHSPDIDLSSPEGAHSFIRHLITLLTLDSRSFGYDTRYSFNYVTNPPQTLFKFGDRAAEIVNEILCYRKCISGRATCVTALGQLVLKVIWRPEDRADEGEALAGFDRVFGFCQVEDASCDIHNTKLEYANKLEPSSATKLFMLDPHHPMDSSTTVSRGIRIQSNILMRRGAPIFEAQNPLHLVRAVHDALLGIMALTEVGKIHCDISAYNLLLVNPEKHYANQNWLDQPSFSIITGIWKRTARCPSEADSSSNDNEPPEVDLEYESPRLKRVKELGRGPCCVLHDTEFMIDAYPNRKDAHPDRTGTPAFISAQLLLANSPIVRTFIHDIESLFWVLVWVLIRHTQCPDGAWTVNNHAKNLIQELSSSNMSGLGGFKKRFIKDTCDADGEHRILELKNPWCEDLVGLVQDFGRFLYFYLYANTTHSKSPDQDKFLDALQDLVRQQHDQYLDQPHQKTFDILFGILERHQHRLEKKYDVDLTRL